VNTLILLMEGLGAFVASTIFLSMIASVIVIAAEEGLRAGTNRAILLIWLRSRQLTGLDLDYVTERLGKSIGLPYQQMAGVLSSLLQASDIPNQVNAKPGISGPNLREIFIQIGARLLNIDLLEISTKPVGGVTAPSSDVPQAPLDDGSLTPEEQRDIVRSMLVDRALDDLQAKLAEAWGRRRYLFSLVAAGLTLFVVSSFIASTLQDQVGNISLFDYVQNQILLAALLSVSVLLTPIFRDLIGRFTVTDQ